MPNTLLTYPILATLIAILSPLGACLLSALMGRGSVSRVLSIGSITCSLLAAIYVFGQVWEQDNLHAQWTWFTVGEYQMRIGILLDNLSVVMLLLVPLIALPVHIYSVAYMAGDPGTHRYWMYLSLFCAAMLGLVVADNLLVMYIFWELVGFASYLLIGYWFTKQRAARASMKAFIINRIGDVGFLVGIALVYAQFGSLDVQHLFGDGGAVTRAVVLDGAWQFGDHAMPALWLTATGIAFFLGAMAKSAQFPLHVWLADAMEGPTSVSSLIHAATMVAAGVFLLARLFPLFDADVLAVIAWIGTTTALLGAFFALTQNDIKKILAFSTVSQLGLMMVAIGTGHVAIAMFYLVVHAFFKCVLFLGAGAVIHEMAHVRDRYGLVFDPQDIRAMGGLRKHMPITAVSMGVAALALAGVPLTAGYLSKDLLLINVFEWGLQRNGLVVLIPFLLIVVSGMTTFYIARCIFKVFFGKLRVRVAPTCADTRVNMAPKPMLIPMLFLALGTLFPFFARQPFQIEELWLVDGLSTGALSGMRFGVLHDLLPVFTTALSTILVFLAWRWYVQGHQKAISTPRLFQLSLNHGYLDPAYQIMFVRPFLALGQAAKSFDARVIDGTVNSIRYVGRKLASVAGWMDFRVVDGLVRLVGKAASWLGNVFRRSQTGRVQYYMYLMVAAVLLVLIYHLVNQG